LTFRWSFGEENGNGEGEETEDRGTGGSRGEGEEEEVEEGDRVFYGNILVGHAVCRRGRRSRSQEAACKRKTDEGQGRSDQ